VIIPRERISSGRYLTRLYVQIKDEVPVEGLDPSDPISRKSRSQRAAITLDFIMQQAQRVFAPYSFSIKNGTGVDWWAAYQIGQRMTSKFSMSDDARRDRALS
jgi:phenol 2-monooxygenase (NADPH)